MSESKKLYIAIEENENDNSSKKITISIYK